jgi:hypothetical protein
MVQDKIKDSFDDLTRAWPLVLLIVAPIGASLHVCVSGHGHVGRTSSESDERASVSAHQAGLVVWTRSCPTQGTAGDPIWATLSRTATSVFVRGLPAADAFFSLDTAGFDPAIRAFPGSPRAPPGPSSPLRQLKSVVLLI